MVDAEKQRMDRSDKSEQERALRLAKEAAASGDPMGTLEHLYRSYFLDGLVRRLHRRWSQLPEPEVAYAVAQAVDVLYKQVSGGRKVSKIESFLFKVAFRKACDYHRMRKRERLQPVSEVGDVPSGTVADESSVVDEEERREEKRKKAIEVARRLLPRLGQETIRSVMGYVLEALEAGREDVPNAEIAEALGLTPGTVRTSLSRAFTRLARIAREEGLTDHELRDLIELETEGEEGDT